MTNNILRLFNCYKAAFEVQQEIECSFVTALSKIFHGEEKKMKMKMYMLATILTFSATGSYAADESLKCRLYISGSLSDDSRTMVEITNAGLTLDAKRQAGFCVFPDGKVADKQWVDLSQSIGDGSSGSAMGYSVYTMENGDSISAKFEGGWDAKGFNALYTILGGTGEYEGAQGDGTVTGAASPWDTSAIVDIVLNVTLP